MLTPPEYTGVYPTRFQITELFGTTNVDIEFSGNCAILVGPNGTGKSSVANIFYFFVSRQWDRLAEYKFKSLAIWFGDDQVEAFRDEITGLYRFSKVLESIGPSSRLFEMISKVRADGNLEALITALSTGSPRYTDWKHIIPSSVSPSEFRNVIFSLQRRLSHDDDDLLSYPKKNIEAYLDKYFPGRTLYLPTYRRIEKDLRDISPKLGRIFKDNFTEQEDFELTRSSKYYVDLVSFGMNDVRSRLADLSRELRDFSLKKFNNLSGLYLKDVIRNKADEYNVEQIQQLSEASLYKILGRVSEDILTPNDKDLLRKRVTSIRDGRAAPPQMQDKYLANYFSRLVTVNEEISLRETDILKFVETCNAYLKPRKEIVYDDTSFSTLVLDDRSGPIDLSVMSSGEKQIVSVFAHLFLDKEVVQTVIIDEPELSLSVPWQKKFLKHVLNSQRCTFLLSVTHSPFVYQNELRPYVIDLRKHMSPAEKS